LKVKEGSKASEGSGSADFWGPLWGARADDWRRTEEQQTPVYEEAIRRLGLGRGQQVLDVGCGTGTFLGLARAAGAKPAGVDASAELLELARKRVPGADLRQGDMQFLPHADDSFDLVTGFTSFFFARDLVAALREARRVAKAGGLVFIQVWGDPSRCSLEAMKQVTRRYLPPPPPGAKTPLWHPGAVEEKAAAAGLEPLEAFDVRFPYRYEDAAEMSRLLMAPMGLASLVAPDAEDEVRERVVATLAPYRKGDGSYLLENEFRCLIARAGR
jgi:SAM-dependent methyltransferase